MYHNSGFQFKHVLPPAATDPSLVIMALGKDKGGWQHVHESLRGHPEVVLEAIRTGVPHVSNRSSVLQYTLEPASGAGSTHQECQN